MIRLNKKQIITLSIVIAVIFASVLAIVIAAQNTKFEMNSNLNISQMTDITVGQNGVVAEGYTTSYSGTAIATSSDLNSFLTDASNASAGNEVYGYLTADITYGYAISNKAFK